MKISLHNNWEVNFDQFDFNSWPIDKRILFLEMAIEIRIKHLLERKNPKIPVSVFRINQQLLHPLTCQKQLDELRDRYDIQSQAFKNDFNQIEREYFGTIY